MMKILQSFSGTVDTTYDAVTVDFCLDAMVRVSLCDGEQLYRYACDTVDNIAVFFAEHGVQRITWDASPRMVAAYGLACWAEGAGPACDDCIGGTS